MFAQKLKQKTASTSAACEVRSCGKKKTKISAMKLVGKMMFDNRNLATCFAGTAGPKTLSFLF
jgi:hypothetical protein